MHVHTRIVCLSVLADIARLACRHFLKRTEAYLSHKFSILE